jgi:hypothetical protein
MLEMYLLDSQLEDPESRSVLLLVEERFEENNFVSWLYKRKDCCQRACK